MKKWKERRKGYALMMKHDPWITIHKPRFHFRSLFQANERSFLHEIHIQRFESLRADYSINSFPRKKWDLLSSTFLK